MLGSEQMQRRKPQGPQRSLGPRHRLSVSICKGEHIMAQRPFHAGSKALRLPHRLRNLAEALPSLASHSRG